MRPALRSVTRRTLRSVFARDRNINFCRLRTLFRSPAFDAVKIRSRNRRTSSSTRRQSTACQSKGASSGPFTTTWSRRPTCPRVPGLRSSFSSQAHLTASAPFQAGPPGSVSAGYPRRPAGGAGHLVSVFRRLSATGVRFSSSDSRRGVGPSLRSAYRTRLLARTSTGLPRSARMTYDRGGCPLCPKDGGAHPGLRRVLAGACRSTTASP